MYYEPSSGREFASTYAFRLAYPDTSFGDLDTEAERNAVGLFTLGEHAPAYNPFTHRLEPAGVVQQGGAWVRGWNIVQHDADTLRANLLAQLTGEYERRMQIIAAAYPPAERESWPVQTSEARALLADAQALTPWIDAAAMVRGVDRAELAQRIVAKDDAYRSIHGALTGARQRIEDVIDAAGDDAEALIAVDVDAGWPGGAA